MKVSIIIPVYNVESYIERCLLSALNQTWQDIEIILVDDCGQDNSMMVALDILASHPKQDKVRILKHEYNRGLSAARNTGIYAAKGEYVYFLDSDDEITSNCIEMLCHLASKYQGVEMAQGNTQTIPPLSPEKDWRNILYKGFPEYVNCNRWIYLHFYDTQNKLIPMNGTNKLVQREFILVNNLFFKEGIIHEDDLWMFWVVKKLHTIAFTTEYTYVAYKRQGSIMQSDDNYRSIHASWVILNEIFNDCNDSHFEVFYKKYMGMLYFNMCRIKLKIKEIELYSPYKAFVKECITGFSKNKKLTFALPLYLLLMPRMLYKSPIGRRVFSRLLCFSNRVCG